VGQPIINAHSKSVNSPGLPILLVLLSNSNTWLLPSFILVSAVVVTSRLQFTSTGGRPDTFDQMYSAGSFRTAAEKISKYKLDLLGVQEVR
jgi:hypothetical protein